MTPGKESIAVNKFVTSLHLPPDVEDDQVDKIGNAVLIEQARNGGQIITGDVERTYDAFVAGVIATGEDGQQSLTYVPVGSPMAAGRTPGDADARMVTWQADSKPREQETAEPIIGCVATDGASRAALPAEVAQSGGTVRFRHGLGGDVTIAAYDAEGAKVGYECGPLCFAIDDNEQQVLLLTPGAVRLEAVRDEEPA